MLTGEARTAIEVLNIPLSTSAVGAREAFIEAGIELALKTLQSLVKDDYTDFLVDRVRKQLCLSQTR